MRKHLFSIAALVLALSSCSGSATGPVNEPHSQISGTWRWTRSEGGIFPRDYGPQTSGYNLTYVFQDSTFTFTRTPDTIPVVSWRGNYDIERHFYSISHDTEQFLALWDPLKGVKPQASMLLRFRGADTMLLGDDATDGIMDTYVRTGIR